MDVPSRDDALDVMLTLATNTQLSMDWLRPRAHSQRFPVLWSAVFSGGAGRDDADVAPG